MRIISQDGTIDVPYDCFSLTIATGKYEDVEVACIYCHNLSSPKGTKLAEYSSKEKAEKAMEMLHDSYDNFEWIKTTGSSDELKALCKHITKEDFKALTSPYFQFPQDEDMEV